MSARSSPSSWASSFAKPLVCVALAVGLIAGGCTQTRVQMVAKYHPGAPSRVDRAPDVGVYKIKYAAGPAGEKMHTLHGSKRFLGKGQPVGFVAGEDGQIIAVAGEERFPALFPAGTRLCVWYTKSEEPSDLARGVGDTLAFVGGATLGVGLVAGIIALELADDECSHGYDRDECRHCCD